ncbi:uncharacterized protein METZ01_LOCUS490428, partial [marine metagenome]
RDREGVPEISRSEEVGTEDVPEESQKAGQEREKPDRSGMTDKRPLPHYSGHTPFLSQPTERGWMTHLFVQCSFDIGPGTIPEYEGGNSRSISPFAETVSLDTGG